MKNIFSFCLYFFLTFALFGADFYSFDSENVEITTDKNIKSYHDIVEFFERQYDISLRILEIGMEIRLTVVDDDGAIIGKAKIDIAVEETDERGNKSTKVTEAEANTEGQYKLEGLIPGKTMITVRMPIERPYLTGTDGKPKKYAVDQDNDNEVRALEQIDGSEEIENEAEAQGGNQNQIVYKLDPGKNNVVKLPVRYLNTTTDNISVPGRASMTEYEFVNHMLGDSYQGNRIAIEKIQIFNKPGLPTEKQVKELLGRNNFPVIISVCL